MAQKSVEILFGKLITDDVFRKRFKDDPPRSINDLRPFGLEFTPVEIEAICSLDLETCELLAIRLDPRLKKVSIDLGRRWS